MEEETLEILWVLFTHLEDTEEEKVVDVAYDLVTQHRFDISELPELVHDAVKEKMDQEMKEFYEEAAYEERKNR